MSDSLRKPWILPAALSFLGQPTDIDGSSKPPKLAQILNVQRTAEFVRCTISDKSNYCHAFIAISKYEAAEQAFDRRSSLSGGIIKLSQFRFIDRVIPKREPLIILIIDEFNFIGGEGSAIHGDPRYIMAVPIVKSAVASKQPAQSSQLIPSSISITYAEELAALGKLSGSEHNIPEDNILTHDQLVIPPDQVTALSNIDLGHLLSPVERSLTYFFFDVKRPSSNYIINYNKWH